MRRFLPLLAAALALAVGLAACGGEKKMSPTPETVEGTVMSTAPLKGKPAVGKQLFASAGCGSCHTFAAAGSTGKTGPDLDEALKGENPVFVRDAILDPNAEIVPGFSKDIMPQNYGEQLGAQELADLVAFLKGGPTSLPA